VWRKLDHATRESYLAIVGHVLEWIVTASATHPDEAFLPLHQTSALPFLKLLLLLDQFLLHPPQPSEPKSFKDVVMARLRLFRKGNLRTLYDRMSAIPCLPKQSGTASFATDDDMCPQAQSLLDQDNLNAGYQRIQSTLPIAQMTDHVKSLCQKLYPPGFTEARTPGLRNLHVINPASP
jgi:hypothetical protein